MLILYYYSMLLIWIYVFIIFEEFQIRIYERNIPTNLTKGIETQVLKSDN